MTIVACQNNTPNQFLYKPFSNPGWKGELGKYPAVKIDSPKSVTGLAKFLSENLVATHRHRAAIVTCYAAEGSEIELMRKRYGKLAENFIKCYEVSETARAVINDWDFGLLRHGQSSDDFWNTQASLMIKAGVEIVEIRKHVGTEPVVFEV